MRGGDRRHDLMRTLRHSPAPLVLITLIAFAAAAGACTGAATTATPDATTPLVSITPVPANVTSVPQGILDAVLADAAARTGVAAEDITVVEATAVTWPNGALGCPQPGMMYTEMIVQGYQVIVEAGGERLDYRIGSGGTPSLCENPPASG